MYRKNVTNINRKIVLAEFCSNVNSHLNGIVAIFEYLLKLMQPKLKCMSLAFSTHL